MRIAGEALKSVKHDEELICNALTVIINCIPVLVLQRKEIIVVKIFDVIVARNLILGRVLIATSAKMTYAAIVLRIFIFFIDFLFIL